MKEVLFTKTHEWVRSDAPGEYTIGITDHAQSLLGDLVFIEFPSVGTEVQAGQEIGVVESVKAASDFYAPIAGTVVAVNEDLKDHPEYVNQTPYQAGWLVKLKADNPNTADLMTENQYQATIG